MVEKCLVYNAINIFVWPKEKQKCNKAKNNVVMWIKNYKKRKEKHKTYIKIKIHLNFSLENIILFSL